MRKPGDYIFATARIRSVEKYLMSHEKIEKMLEAATPVDAMKVLYDMEYGEGVGQVAPEHYEKLLTEEHNWVYDFISSIAPDPREFILFRYPYDYHNLKVLLKAEFKAVDPKPMLLEFGSIETGKLEEMVRERKLEGMTDIMKNAVFDTIEIFSKTRDPQRIDLIMDKACYADMLAEAEDVKSSSFLLDYVRLVIDTANLRSLARLRKLRESQDFFAKVLLPGGNVTEKIFMESYEDSLEQFTEKMIPFGYHAMLAPGGAMLRETGKFTTLEKLCDDKAIQLAREARYITFGIEPIAAYLIAKEHELKSARIIMAGKLAGLSRDVIRERVREAYV